MKRTKMTLLATLFLCGMITFSSCIGSFRLTNNLLSWNRTIGNKFLNELIFIVISPAYAVTSTVDALVLNSIEFWGGNNPVASNDIRKIETENGTWLVERTGDGYQITNADNEAVMQLSFDEPSQSWFYELDGEKVKFMSFIDNDNVRMYLQDGSAVDVELSEAGVVAFQQHVEDISGTMFAGK